MGTFEKVFLSVFFLVFLCLIAACPSMNKLDAERRARWNVFVKECAKYTTVYDCDQRFRDGIPSPDHPVDKTDAPPITKGGPT